MSETQTLQGIFEAQAAALGVIVLRGDDVHDGHARTDAKATPDAPEYVMLPGGMDDAATYAAGLHELGHVANDRARTGTRRAADLNTLAHDVAEGKLKPSDALKTVVFDVLGVDERLLAVIATQRSPIVPMSAYVEVIDDEAAAWRWAEERVRGAGSGMVFAEELAAFDAMRAESLASYLDGAEKNARAVYDLIAEHGKTLAFKMIDATMKTVLMAYLHDKDGDGCGTCPACVERAARTKKAEAKYERALKDRRTEVKG